MLPSKIGRSAGMTLHLRGERQLTLCLIQARSLLISFRSSPYTLSFMLKLRIRWVLVSCSPSSLLKQAASPSEPFAGTHEAWILLSALGYAGLILWPAAVPFSIEVNTKSLTILATIKSISSRLTPEPPSSKLRKPWKSHTLTQKA
jgi:hypothetical protein